MDPAPLLSPSQQADYRTGFGDILFAIMKIVAGGP
jgi:hypothetical protein